jgi:uncharacterized protein
MELNNQFHVSVPVEEAWAVLTDLERVAPCLPGAELREVDGDDFKGIVKVKVGPIAVQYKGTVRFVEKDDAEHRAVLRAEGRDTRGQGNASATITAVVLSEGDGATVEISTDLSITGKAAQFGRSAMTDVSAKLLAQFAERLEADVLSQGTAAPAETSEAAPAASPTPESPDDETVPTVRAIHAPPAEPVDLLSTAGPTVLKRAVPVAVVLLVIFLLWRRRR